MSLPVRSHNFDAFVEQAFQSINPQVVFHFNWHIQAITRLLNEAVAGDQKRIIINIPPRALKSQLISVAWPAWLLGMHPAARVMTASYSQKLSEKHSVDCRNLMLSDFYRALFPHTVLASDQNQKHKFATTARGYRVATSVGGTATGEGGNFLIVDDPHNPNHIYSPSRRKTVTDWFENTWMSRLDSKMDGVIVAVMQRLHEDDLSGHLLSKPNNPWHVLSLPAIAEEDSVVECQGARYVRQAGDLLQPARESLAQLNQLKAEMGTHSFSAQYQQTPLSAEGNMIKREWLQLCKADEIPVYEEVIQSWDTASSTKEQNDYSVCTSWGVHKAGYVLLDVYRDKLVYTDLVAKAKALCEQWNPSTILIENQSSGKSLLQELYEDTHLPVVPVNPKWDKLHRLMYVTPLFESRKILIAKQHWTDVLIGELLTFPHGKHDDQVDSISQFLHYRKQQSSSSRPRIATF
jgi:predicted phage terminase large subunit-like protein